MARYSKTKVVHAAQVLFIAFAIALRMGGGTIGIASYFAIAAYALLGRAHVIHALALCWFFTFMNPALGSWVPGSSVLRYVVFLACAVSLLRTDYGAVVQLRFRRLTLASVVVGITLVLHSLLFSQVRDVSVLKAVSFTGVAIIAISAWSGFDGVERAKVERQLLGGLLFLIVVSTPLLATSFGFMKNGRGYQGPLSHPQVFGPFAAFVAAWLIGRVASREKPPVWMLLSLGLCVALAIASEARVAAAALALGVTFAMLMFRSSKPLRSFFPGIRSGRVQLLLGAATMAALLAGPILYERAIDFAKKGNDASSAVEAAEQSRGRIVRNMTDNIERYFWTGIGFGVASDNQSLNVERDDTYGLPVGAAIEKGVMPIAVLEELGPFGAVVVFGWIAMLFVRARGRLDGLCVFLTCLASNLGEATFFAAGGTGMLILNLSAWAATEPRHGPTAAVTRAAAKSAVLATPAPRATSQ